MYDLKEASRHWNQKLSSVLLADGFTQSRASITYFLKETAPGFLALLVYVDDIDIASNNSDDLASLKDIFP